MAKQGSQRPQRAALFTRPGFLVRRLHQEPREVLALLGGRVARQHFQEKDVQRLIARREGRGVDALQGDLGGGGGGRWRQSYWVWPLPPSGPLAFVCEWSAASIPVTRREIDAQLVLDAAERAQQIFEAGPRSEGGGNWTSFAVGGTRANRPNEPKPGES